MSQLELVSVALGKFGPWQARSLFLIALVKIPAAWQMMSILYLAPHPETLGGSFFCARPNNSDSWPIREWIDTWHPKEKTFSGGYDPCFVYRNGSDFTEKIECTEFEFLVEKPTMVTKWSLVCSRGVLVNVVQFFYLLGIFLGGMVTSLLMKKISPRAVILLGAALQVSSGIALALQPIFEVHCALKCLVGLSACIMFTAAFQIIADVSFGWQKIVLGVSYEHFWSIGVLTLGWLNELAGSWSALQLIITIPTSLFLFLFWALPNSPRWLIAQGKLEQAEVLLKKAAAENGTRIPSDFSLQTNPGLPTGKNDEPLPKFKIFCLQIIWISTIITYYGGLLNYRSVGATSLPTRTTIAGGAEIFGTFIGLGLLLKPRFKISVMALLLIIGGTCCISSWAIEPNERGSRGGWQMVFLACAGRVSIATTLAVMSNGGSAEFIPLSKRPTTMLCLLTIGRLFLLSAPFLNSLAVYGESVTLSIYGGLILSAGIAALFLSAKSELKGLMVPLTTSASKNGDWNVQRLYSSCNETVVVTHFNQCFVDDHGFQNSTKT